MTRIAINGSAGRMGRRLVALTLQDQELRLAAALEHAGHGLLGQDAGVLAGVAAAGVTLSDKLPGKGSGGSGASGGVDVLVDFTAPAGTREALAMCVKTGIAMVIGTTGLSAEDHAAIDKAGKKIAVLQAPNMSLGVNLLFALAAQVAKRLGDDYDIEIVEAHHRFKKDAPSGTALGLAQAICEATGKDMKRDLVHGRQGDDVTRRPGQIGMHSLRSGDVVGRHTVTFGAAGEEIALAHTATTRDVFAHGALRAAKWLAGKKAGRYQMKDVLGL